MNRLAAVRHSTTLRRHALALLVGFVCTLPAQADITFPSTPLQSGSTIPPNVTLILDDSGSMYWRYLYAHNSDGTFPTIAVPVNGATAALTSKNTGDETSKDNFNGSVPDGYGNTCFDDGNNSYTDCVASSINNDKYMVDQSYNTNGLYYNPAVTYTPWHYPNGTSVPNTAYTAAFQDHDNATYSWTAVDTTTKIITTSGTTNLSTHTQTFYVPKTVSSDATQAVNYYRYQILGSTEFPAASGKIYQAQLLQASDVTSTGSTNTNVLNQTGVSAAKNAFSTFYSITVPTGATVLTVTTSGGTGNAAWLFVRQGSSNPTTTTYTCRANATGTNSQTCTINTPTAGTYKVGVYGNNAPVAGVTITGTVATPTFTIIHGVTGVGCNDTQSTGYDWRYCTEVTPTGRSATDEKQNFANWYSFYETRIKTAKAGLTAAFSSLTSIPRVGFYPINSSSANNTSRLDIPVSTDDGLFEDKAATTGPVTPASVNKTNWFNAVIKAKADSGTPLRTALNTIGTYYTSNAVTGPYSDGPTQAVSDQLSCRQNFTILTTDGYWNDSFTLANQDGAAGSQIDASPDGVHPAYTYAAAYPYKDTVANTLADVAMKYWKTDLRTDMDNRLNVSDTDPDPAFWQHMTTFTISIGARGTLDPAVTLAKIAAGTAFTWPTPASNGVTTIDDLFHAAVNGHGSFVVASDPTGFVNGLTNALSQINKITSSSSSVAINSTQLATGTQVFQSVFKVGDWTGDLKAFSIDSSGNVSASASWSAASLLDAETYTSRKIFTWNGSAGVNFPTTAQTTTLGGANVANYIKGDRSNEGTGTGKFRVRASVLGDLVDSSPAYVPADTTASTPAMLYVGGNDGMMHAFNASTGAEVFAYVPAGINFANLATLTDPKYVHQYFVDGSIVVSTKDQTKTLTDTTGKNILVGTLGRGGKTVYALDVSDPNAFGTGKVLWEYTDTDMGNSLGTPIITKVNTADAGNGNTAVILGNGPNSTSGHSVLYVLNIRTGALIKKIDTGYGDTTTNSNGMSTPKGWDSDHSGTADLIYAGDLQGNLWKFTIASSTATTWDSALKVAGSPVPMYVAEAASGKRQPITGGLAIGLNPDDFQRWVFFGTGRYLTNGDPTDTTLQSWYGMIDAGAVITTTVARNDTTSLKQRTIAAISIDPTTSSKVRAFSPATTGDMAGKKGWYVDLEGSISDSGVVNLTDHTGERIISDTVLLAGVLLVPSVIPAADACSVGGDGYINAIDPFTGGALTTAFFDSNGDGVVDASDSLTYGTSSLLAGSIDLGVGMPSLPGFIQKILVGTGTNGKVRKIDVHTPTNTGRISWREIIIGN